MLTDAYGRPLTHLRASVTLRCNYRCVFCHGEGLGPGRGYEMGPHDYRVVARAAVGLGIKYVKITGGEPLVRGDIVEVVGSFAGEGARVSMVTNGSLLARYAGALADAGLSRVNVSLHSLREEVYRWVTGGGRLDDALAGLRAAADHGLGIKINFVVLRDNLEDFPSVLGLASDLGAALNVIELIPLGMARGEYERLHVPLDPILEYLESRCTRRYRRGFQSRPVYVLDDGVRVEVVKGYGNPEMCAACTRLRLTPDGRLRVCLYRSDGVDLLPILRSEADEESKVRALRGAIMEANTMRRPFFTGGGHGEDGRREP